RRVLFRSVTGPSGLAVTEHVGELRVARALRAPSVHVSGDPPESTTNTASCWPAANVVGCPRAAMPSKAFFSTPAASETGAMMGWPDAFQYPKTAVNPGLFGLFGSAR